MKDFYRRISCDLYDQLEAWSVQKHPLYLQIQTKEKRIEIGPVTVDSLYTKEKSEYARLSNGMEIRLDKILHFSPVK